MLCKDKIIPFFCLIDDVTRQVYDNEIILTVIVSLTSFYGNHCSSIKFIKQYRSIPNIDKAVSKGEYIK